MRVITFIHEVVEQADGQIVVYLISIYDKSDTANISDKYLAALINDVVSNIQSSEEQTNNEGVDNEDIN